MSNLYDSPSETLVEIPESGLNMDSAISLPAGITLQVGSFDGKRWFALLQGGQSIAVTGDELEGLISGLWAALRDNDRDPAPEQLQLFDPENPPEAPNEHGVDTAQ
jgi:hypothetical protein